MDATTASQHIVVALKQNKIVTIFDLTSCVLLFYDYLLTLPDEVELIWKSDWSAIKIAFLLTRYAAFGNTVVGLYRLIFCSIALSEIILIYRTYAVWGKPKMFGYALGLLLMVAWIVEIVYMEKNIRSMESPPASTVLPGLPGCFVKKINHTLIVSWTTVLGFETIIIGLTMIKALQNLKQTSSPLLYVIFRDSALAYAALLVSSIANVLVILLAPTGSAYLLSETQHALHVVLVARIVLNIRRGAQSRAVASNMEEIELQQTVSAFQAASRP
ncbi:hypothetical protein DENSPDRAFT_874719 [Dentipellis sp. KUC8613]|nr:hypothetical protein DENSPDRAFT_874719 [Dentipellis sp. KUC8613]